jgi:hypothetical protein
LGPEPWALNPAVLVGADLGLVEAGARGLPAALEGLAQFAALLANRLPRGLSAAALVPGEGLRRRLGAPASALLAAFLPLWRRS